VCFIVGETFLGLWEDDVSVSEIAKGERLMHSEYVLAFLHGNFFYIFSPVFLPSSSYSSC
jgi:hypothetical protein